VVLQLGTGVSAIEPGAVVLADGRRILAGTVIWAAGVKAGPLAAASGLPLGGGGRTVVDDQLRVPTHPNVYVIGDIGASLDGAGGVLPQVAQVAIQGAQYVGRSICSELMNNKAPAAFRYRNRGTMATIGLHAAVAEFPLGLRLWGPLGWVAWLEPHVVHLIGFRNRINVLVNWSWNYLTYDHGSRLMESNDD